MTLQWIGDNASERAFTVDRAGSSIPGIFWQPESHGGAHASRPHGAWRQWA